jgi:DNA-binding transcriptional LysR family regulator
MRIVDMETFVTLARHRHFGRAAQELNTTQPAISARLAALEREIGRQLVDRGERRFALTPAGRKVLESFKDVLETMNGLRLGLEAGEGTEPALIRLGAIDSVVSTWMPLLIETLHEAVPNLKIELTVEGTKLLHEGMQEGAFDLVFAVDPLVGEGFQSFLSCVMEMVWAGSDKVIDSEHVYSVDDLARLPIISFPKDTPPFRQIAPYFHDESVLASKLTSSNSLFAIINLLIDGFGVGAIPTVTHRASGIRAVTPDALKLLRAYSWPGNVRQLRPASKSIHFAPHWLCIWPGQPGHYVSVGGCRLVRLSKLACLIGLGLEVGDGRGARDRFIRTACLRRGDCRGEDRVVAVLGPAAPAGWVVQDHA